MIFIKKTLPLIITFVTGMIMILAYFAGEGTSIHKLEQVLPNWIQIIMTFTMVLGAISLLRINVQKVMRKADGWGYSVVLLVGFFSMSIFGFLGGTIQPSRQYENNKEYYVFKEGSLKTHKVKITDGTVTKEGKVVVINLADENMEKQVASDTAMQDASISFEPYEIHTDRLYSPFMRNLKVCEQLMFVGVFKPAQSTMFSLLAFFVASASFRAFRIKSKEAALLMISAFIVMLGNVPFGRVFTNIPYIGQFLDMAEIKEWIMTYPSSAAQSAILIGAMLGYITSSMKIIFGIERSHLGGD